MKFIKTSIICVLILSGCGFKLIEQNKLKNFHIHEIEATGEKRINYLLKNKLLITSKNNTTKKINLILNSKKNKTIKEKNKRNEITKYNINIITTIEYESVSSKKKDKFTILENGILNVSTQNSLTRNAERKLIDLLTEKISDKIVDGLILRLHDH